MGAIDPQMIVIVSGLPRSGTSMMMRMLEAGGIPVLVDNIRKADVDNPRGYYEFEPVKKTKEDPSWLADAPGRVVKMVYRLLRDLPADHTYHVVFTRRHLDEVIKSQDVMLEHLGKDGGSLPKEKLRSLYEQQLQEFDDWIAAQPNFRVLYTNYNETLGDPRKTATAVARFLGGKLNVDAMVATVEPELYRQRAEG